MQKLPAPPKQSFPNVGGNSPLGKITGEKGMQGRAAQNGGFCIILTKGRLSVAIHGIFGITSPAGGWEAGRYLQLGRNETPPMFTIFRRETVASGFVYRCSDFPLTSLISRPGVGRVWVLVIGALLSSTPGRIFGISQAPTASSMEL